MRNSKLWTGIFLLLLSSLLIPALPEVFASNLGGLSVTPLQLSFNVTPGSSFTVPIKLVNTGNSIIRNLSIETPGIQGVLMSGWENISTNISPGASTVFRFPVRVMERAPAGEYNATILVRANNLTFRFLIRVKVALIPLYTLNISVGKRYHVGQNVTVVFSIRSAANGVLRGPVWLTIYRNGREIYSRFYVVFLNASGVWTLKDRLVNPAVGNYTVSMVANLSGRKLSIEKSFSVFRRRFTLKAWFRNGYINAEVRFANGTPIAGLPVSVNSKVLRTDSSGTVRMAVERPGVYVVSTSLDGVNRSVVLNVEGLVLSTSVEKGVLLVSVVSTAGTPVPNVSVSVSGPKGTFSGVTGADGVLKVPLSRVGWGIVLISATSPDYLGVKKMINVPPMTSSTSSPTSSSSPSTFSTPTSTVVYPPSESSHGHRFLSILMISLAAVIFTVTFYVSFLRHRIIEDELKSHYFVKVRASPLRPLRNFRFEKVMNAVEVRATRGRARIEGNKVVWEIDELERGEEAVMQVILG